MEVDGTLRKLKNEALSDFEGKLIELRQVMELIDKSEIRLLCSHPFNGEHIKTPTVGYELFVDKERIRMKTMGGMKDITSMVLMRVSWYDLYVYTVEMELQMKRIYNHLKDSLLVHSK